MALKRWHWGWVAIVGLAACTGCSMIRPAPQETVVVPEQVDPQAKLSLAKLAERHGDAAQATELYQNILLDDPQNQAAHHRLAVLAAQAQKLDVSEFHFEQAMALGQPTAELLNDRAYSFYLNHDLDRAEETARQAIAQEPQNKVARNNLALILGEKGQFDASLAEFRRVVSEAEAQANVGYVRAMAGDLVGAEKALHHALEMDSTLRPAANALLELSDRRRGIVRDVAPELKPVGPRSEEQQTAQATGMINHSQLQQPANVLGQPQGQANNPNAQPANQGVANTTPQTFAPWAMQGQAQPVSYQAPAGQPQTVGNGHPPGTPLGQAPQNNSPWAQAIR